MKTICTLLLCLSILTVASAQRAASPKLRKTNERLSDCTLNYTVLQENPAIKHGPYKMDGRFWHCEGTYDMNQRAGVWSFYGWNGKLDYQFDFTTGKEVFSDRRNDSLDQKIKVYQEGQYVKTEVGSRAFYLGGDARVMSFMGRHIRYPAAAQRVEAQGTTIIAVEIDEEGKLIHMEVAKEIGFGMDEEAMRVLSLLPQEWIPAMIDGKPVRSKSYIPIRFALK